MAKENEAPKVGRMMAALDWAYDKAVNGIPKLDRAEDLADSYIAIGRLTRQSII